MTKDELKDFIIKQVEESAPDQLEMVKQNIDMIINSGMMTIDGTEKVTYQMGDNGWYQSADYSLDLDVMGQKIKTRTAEALEMAIKALEQESTTKNDLGVDCISRKADMHYPPESESAYEKALLKAYADGQASVESKWIPVSERLPEESYNSVLGWDAYRERCVLVQYLDGRFQIMGKTESFDIRAWMPLPEPFEPQKSGGKE